MSPSEGSTAKGDSFLAGQLGRKSPHRWPKDQVSQISGYDPPEVTRCCMGARIVEVGCTKEVFYQGIRILMDEMEGALVQ